jgi:hypothetical protein
VGMHELGAMVIIFLGVTLVKRSAGVGQKAAVQKAVTG